MQQRNTHFGLSLFIAIILGTIIFIFYDFFTETDDQQTLKQNGIILAQRLAPIGKVYLEGDINIAKTAKTNNKPQPNPRSAQQIYKNSCAACHDTGIAAAPKLGNKPDWVDRKKRGIAELIKVAIVGKNAMPPKGTCSDCSDKELEEVVKYMINSLK